MNGNNKLLLLIASVPFIGIKFNNIFVWNYFVHLLLFIKIFALKTKFCKTKQHEFGVKFAAWFLGPARNLRQISLTFKFVFVKKKFLSYCTRWKRRIPRKQMVSFQVRNDGPCTTYSVSVVHILLFTNFVHSIKWFGIKTESEFC